MSWDMKTVDMTYHVKIAINEGVSLTQRRKRIDEAYRWDTVGEDFLVSVIK